MTPAQIEEAARQKYNSVGDSFYSSSEILYWIYQACLELAQEAQVIERTYTTTTTASQQEYAMPTNTIQIKRITYNGNKLKPITQREDDVLTQNNQATTSTGTPQYYYVFNETIYLRPIPDDAYTLKIFSVNEPQALTVTSTLEVPTQFHMGLVDFVVREMVSKDSNWEAADRYDMRWQKTVKDAKRWTQKKRRGDSFAYVQDEACLAESYLGVV